MILFLSKLSDVTGSRGNDIARHFLPPPSSCQSRQPSVRVWVARNYEIPRRTVLGFGHNIRPPASILRTSLLASWQCSIRQPAHVWAPFIFAVAMMLSDIASHITRTATARRKKLKGWQNYSSRRCLGISQMSCMTLSDLGRCH